MEVGIRMLLQVTSAPLVPSDSPVFHFAQKGGLVHIRDLITEGKASPRDVMPSGNSALDVSIALGFNVACTLTI